MVGASGDVLLGALPDADKMTSGTATMPPQSIRAAKKKWDATWECASSAEARAYWMIFLGVVGPQHISFRLGQLEKDLKLEIKGVQDDYQSEDDGVKWQSLQQELRDVRDVLLHLKPSMEQTLNTGRLVKSCQKAARLLQDECLLADSQALEIRAALSEEERNVYFQELGSGAVMSRLTAMLE